MLVVSRRIGEVIVISKNIRVKILGFSGNQVRIGIEAPTNVIIDREEIHLRRVAEEAPAPTPTEVLS